MLLRSGKPIGFGLAAVVLVALAGCSTGSSRPAPIAESMSSESIDPAAGESARITAGAAAASGMPLAPVEIPERAMSSYSRALLAMNDADWVEAELELELLILDYPSFPGPYINLSILYRRDGRIDDAESVLTRALEVAPGHPVANNELGVLNRERGDFAAAEAAYRRAIAAEPTYALAHYNLGVLLDLYLKREAEALEQYEAYLSFSPEPDAVVQRWVVDLRRRLGVPDEPVQIAQELGP